MTTAQVVETSVTVNNSPIQDYVHPDDQTQPTFIITVVQLLWQQKKEFGLTVAHFHLESRRTVKFYDVMLSLLLKHNIVLNETI